MSHFCHCHAPVHPGLIARGLPRGEGSHGPVPAIFCALPKVTRAVQVAVTELQRAGGTAVARGGVGTELWCQW